MKNVNRFMCLEEKMRKKVIARKAAAVLLAITMASQVAVTAASAVPGELLPTAATEELKLWYDEPVPQVLDKEDDPNNFAGWREYSIPMGCGYMGVNLFGGVDSDRIQITENSLQDSNNSIGGLNNFSETYLEFNYGYDDVENYRRQLILNDGISSVEYDYNGTHYTREYFTSYPDKVMVIHLTADGDQKLDFTLRPTIPYLCDSRTVDGVVKEDRGKIGTVVAEGDTITLSGMMEYYQLKYEGQYRVIPDGGIMTAQNDENGDNGTITVTGANSAYIVIGVGTNYELNSSVFTASDKNKVSGNPDPHDKVTQIVDQASAKSYEELKSNHLADYHELYQRVDLDLGGSVPETLTTDQLVANYKTGEYDSTSEGRYLEELFYQFGRYLVICSSRKGALPANLQGVWNVYQDPPWRSGYWHNINVQMNYWGIT